MERGKGCCASQGRPQHPAAPERPVYIDPCLSYPAHPAASRAAATTLIHRTRRRFLPFPDFKPMPQVSACGAALFRHLLRSPCARMASQVVSSSVKPRPRARAGKTKLETAGRVSCGNGRRTGPLFVRLSLNGKKRDQSRHIRKLDRILVFPVCQRTSLAIPQPLVVVPLSSPHRKQDEV